MEEHAVPQNITTFEFKLFGPFTIRQFIYVAIGGIIGAVFYFSPLPKTFSYIVGGLFVLTGIAFAAIPLQGRPLDKWIVAFFRSITRPTQRIWIKDNHIPYFLEANFLKSAPAQQVSSTVTPARISRSELQTLLARQSHSSIVNPFDQRESQFLAQIASLESTVKATSAPPPQNQGINQNPFSPYQQPIQNTRSTTQAAPKPAQLKAKEEEIKAQELALIEKQKALETSKIKLEEEKQKKLNLLSEKLTEPQSQKAPVSLINKGPDAYSAPINQNHVSPENLNPNREIKVLPYTPDSSVGPNTSQNQSPAPTEQSKQKLAELDEILRSQQQIEAEIKAKEQEILRQQESIQKEQEKFSKAWEDFKKNKSLAENGGINTSTPDMFQKHLLPNVGKKTVVSPLPSSNFSAVSSQPSIAAQIASEINFGGNVIAIPGNQIQFMQGIGDTRIRKLKTRPPDFSKGRLPILGERQFDISQELKKRFENPEPQPQKPIQMGSIAGGIAIEEIKKVKDFEPIRAGKISEKDSKDFAPPPSPNLNRPATSSNHQMVQPAKTEPNTGNHDQKHGGIVQPFNYESSKAKAAPKAEIKINLSEHPNTPNGIVYNSNGELVQGALISVFDTSGKPVRAFKTNGLGQFISVTPLANGKYTIQTDFDGLNFDTIAFEAKGQLLDPFAITAKTLQN